MLSLLLKKTSNEKAIIDIHFSDDDLLRQFLATPCFCLNIGYDKAGIHSVYHRARISVEQQ